MVRSKDKAGSGFPFSVLISSRIILPAGKGFLGKQNRVNSVSSQELDAAQGNQIRKT